MKFLDYTRLGIPGIYTDYTPYDPVKQNNAGLMIQTDWVEPLSIMIEDRAKRDAIRESAIEYVSGCRNLEIQMAQWKNLLNAL